MTDRDRDSTGTVRENDLSTKRLEGPALEKLLSLLHDFAEMAVNYEVKEAMS